jgi:ubiquinone/menaquinone biosynthesis C-methylase UbiE
MDTVSIWNGRAHEYDASRPHTPEVLVDMLTQFIGEDRPRLVVDLGSGTGLSTYIWSDHARHVVGVEPNEEMRQVAKQRLQQSGLSNIEFRAASSTHTGLDDGCADIVTCSQSLHWMEPKGTFAEAARILRHGGLFVAYDYDWPPTVNWEVDEAYRQLIERVDHIVETLGWQEQENEGRWSKEGHLTRMRESKRFRFTKEILLHHIEEGDAARFVRLIASNYLSELKSRGINDHEIGFDTFKAEVERFIGDQTMAFYFSYHARIGIK